MTVSFIGSQTQDSGASLSLTFTVPAACQTGDLIIVFVKQSENTGAQIWDDDGGGGNGYVQRQYNRLTSGRDQETAVYYKIATSNNEPNPTFTWNTSGTSEPMSGSILVYRGTNGFLADPFDDIRYAANQNDPNPPNPQVTVTSDPVSIVCLHAATHDDITSPAAPTGYTLRTQVWNGTANDHRNHFTADLLNQTGLGGSYTPPSWQHTAANNTPEYHTYTLAFGETPSIYITDQGDEQIDIGDTNETVLGAGFGATQGTGKVEFADGANYATATKVTQTIDSWSDTSIQFDFVSTGLPEGAIYCFVTNDSAERSAPYQVNFGVPDYNTVIRTLGADIIHSFNNNFNDTGVIGGSYSANGQVNTNPNSFKAISGARGTTHTWGTDSITGKIEMSDTPYTNTSSSHQAREICGWFRAPANPYKVPTVIWEEGGGVNNLYMAMGAGNAMFFNIADSNGSPAAFKSQSYANFTLTPLRWYHLLGRWEGANGIGGTELWIDGVKQNVNAGDQAIADTTFSSHSGDWSYGDADGNLDTGGTDIAYSGANGGLYSYWATWSTTSNPSTGMLTNTERRVELFEKGAPSTDEITGGTEANMQTAMDAIAPKAYSDVPLPLKINRKAGGGNLTIDLDSVTFDSKCSIHVQWMGTVGETLTIVNNGTSNCELSMCSVPYGGTVVISNPATFTVNGLINGCEVRIYDDLGTTTYGTELQGTETLSGTSINYSHDGTTNPVIVQMIATGYKEITTPFTLGSSDQTLTVNPEVETNA